MAIALFHPITFVRGRFQRWWQARLPLLDTMTLTQRNVYILPTRAGFMLGATLAVLLVGAINYQLNLGYLLTFLLAGQVAPVMLLPDGIRTAATVLPFRYMVSFPVEVLMGQVRGVELWQGLALKACWLALALLLFALVWRA